MVGLPLTDCWRFVGSLPYVCLKCLAMCLPNCMHSLSVGVCPRSVVRNCEIGTYSSSALPAISGTVGWSPLTTSAYRILSLPSNCPSCCRRLISASMLRRVFSRSSQSSPRCLLREYAPVFRIVGITSFVTHLRKRCASGYLDCPIRVYNPDSVTNN